MKIGNRPFVELHEQLHAAIAAHKKYTADAMNGMRYFEQKRVTKIYNNN